MCDNDLLDDWKFVLVTAWEMAKGLIKIGISAAVDNFSIFPMAKNSE